MSPVMEAHLRLLATLPSRVHEQRVVVSSRDTGRPERDVARQRRLRIRVLLSQGVSQRRIAGIIGVSRTSVQKHVRAIKRGK